MPTASAPLAAAFPYPVQLTMLNSMGGRVPTAALAAHRALGVHLLDLKDTWFGRAVQLWTLAEAEQVAAAAAERDLHVVTLSTTMGGLAVERGEAAYAEGLAAVEQVVRLAAIFRPTRIRLVAPSVAPGRTASLSLAELATRHPWLFPRLRAAVDRLAATGAEVVIENESPGSVLGDPDEVREFFALLARPHCRLIWDIGNWWHMGRCRFPTIDDARALLPLIGMLHLKGGIADAPGGRLRWQAQLAETSWDVRGIVAAVIAAGAAPLICLNHPHGAARPGITHSYAADLAWLRATFPEIAP